MTKKLERSHESVSEKHLGDSSKSLVNLFDYEPLIMLDGWNLTGSPNYPHSICPECHISWSAHAKYLLHHKKHSRSVIQVESKTNV